MRLNKKHTSKQILVPTLFLSHPWDDIIIRALLVLGEAVVKLKVGEGRGMTGVCVVVVVGGVMEVGVGRTGSCR